MKEVLSSLHRNSESGKPFKRRIRIRIRENPDSEDQSDAQAEWEASLQQLELVLTMVIVPYAGKYFGRKFAYWSTFSLELLRCGNHTFTDASCVFAGWGKYMEWMYPVEVEITNKRAFRAAGAVAAATL